MQQNEHSIQLKNYQQYNLSAKYLKQVFVVLQPIF